jgi:hypothetical protein
VCTGQFSISASVPLRFRFGRRVRGLGSEHRLALRGPLQPSQDSQIIAIVAVQEDVRLRRNHHLSTTHRSRRAAGDPCHIRAGHSFQFHDITIMISSDQTRRPWIRVLLLIPYIALLWLPFYNDVRPSLLGFPFFYWYQLLWVPVTSLLLYIVYRSFK